MEIETLKKIEELEKQLSELPESIDISDRPEVQEIQRKIAEKEAAMNKRTSRQSSARNRLPRSRFSDSQTIGI